MSNIIIPDTIVEEIELTVKTNSCAALHATPARIDTSLSEPIDPSASSSTRNSQGGSSPVEWQPAVNYCESRRPRA